MQMTEYCRRCSVWPDAA